MTTRRPTTTVIHPVAEWLRSSTTVARSRTVVVGGRSLAVTHQRRRYGGLDEPPARTRAVRSARARSRTGWLRCPWHGYDYDPLTGKPPPGFSDAPECLRVHRDPTTACTSRSRARAPSGARCPTCWSRRSWLGRHPRVRHGRPLQPRLRRCDAQGRAARRPHVRRHPPRGRRRVRRVGVRQAHRAARGLLRHRRPGLHEPVDRPLRRQGRPLAGARDLRPGAVEGAAAAARSRTPTSRPRSSDVAV